MKTKNKKSRSPWRLYMNGEVGKKGYYVTTPNDHFYGPFKSEKIAQFFNLLAFGDPRSANVKDYISKTIKEFNSVADAEHPSTLIGSNSKFALWWRATFDLPFSNETALKLARETGAQGYDSFRNWLINGSQLNSKHVMYMED